MPHLYGPRFRALHCCTDRIITDALSQMELTASQGRILGFIARQNAPPCPKDIEEHFRLSHPSVCGTLHRMEKKGFIEFLPDRQDHRCKRIILAPRGSECCQRIQKVISDIENQVVNGFSPEEQEIFSRLLDRAIRNINKEEPQC